MSRCWQNTSCPGLWLLLLQTLVSSGSVLPWGWTAAECTMSPARTPQKHLQHIRHICWLLFFDLVTSFNSQMNLVEALNWTEGKRNWMEEFLGFFWVSCPSHTLIILSNPSQLQIVTLTAKPPTLFNKSWHSIALFPVAVLQNSRNSKWTHATYVVKQEIQCTHERTIAVLHRNCCCWP